MISKWSTIAFQTLIAILLPLVVAKVLNPVLLEGRNPQDLGCCGPLAGLGLMSGILMALQLRLNLSTASQKSLSRVKASPSLLDLEPSLNFERK